MGCGCAPEKSSSPVEKFLPVPIFGFFSSVHAHPIPSQIREFGVVIPVFNSPYSYCSLRIPKRR